MPPSAANAASTTGVLLVQNAEVKSIKLGVSGNTSFTLDIVKKLLKKKDRPDLVLSYPSKSVTLHLFGYSKGKAGKENKHELPPPHDSVLFFDDILVVASKEENSYDHPVSFKPEDYETFYTKAFGGFDDLDGEEELDEEEDVMDDVVEEADEVEEGKEFDGAEDEEEAVEEEAEEAEEGGEDGDVVVKKTKKRPVAAKSNTKAKTTKKGSAVAPIGFTSYTAIEPELELKPDADASDPTRTACRAAIGELFKNVTSDQAVLDGIERCIYNGSLLEADQRHVVKSWTNPAFIHLYKMFARHLTSNLHPDSYVKNKELWVALQAGMIRFEDISKMNSYEMAPARWKESFEKQQVREKNQLEGNRAMATDQFLCTRCWKRECTYYEMQTRSADEPMTIFITCINCGKHWRQ